MTPTDTLTRGPSASRIPKPSSAARPSVPAGQVIQPVDVVADPVRTVSRVADPRRHRSRSDRLLGAAAAVVVLGFVGALLGLVALVPDTSEITTLSGPAVVAGVVGMYTAVAGLTLAYVAAVRSHHE
jgi:hypothetical protein